MRKFLSKALAIVLVLILSMSSIPQGANLALAAPASNRAPAVQSIYDQKAASTQPAKTTPNYGNTGSKDNKAKSIDSLNDIAGTEDVSLRTEFFKNYKLANGLKEYEVYSEAIHYKDSKGEFQPIDNSLQQITDKDGQSKYKNTANEFSVLIGANKENKWDVEVSKGDYSISWKLLGEYDKKSKTQKAFLPKEQWSKQNEGQKRHTIPNLSSEVKFSNVLENIDLRYHLESEYLKQDLIINKYTDIPSFAEKIEMKGLEPVSQEDGSVSFVDLKTKEEIFVMPAPFMVDSQGSTSNISTKITQDDSYYTFTYTLDAEWLKTADYPVTIDPVVGFPNTVNDINDTRLVEASPTTNYGGSSYLATGYKSTTLRNYTLIRFANLPSVNGNNIYSAAMGVTTYCSSGSSTVGVYKVTSSWTSMGATWRNPPSYDQNVYWTKTISGSSGQYCDWGMCDIVRYWYLTANYGVLMKTVSDTDNYMQWYSSDAGGNHPQAAIAYDDTAPGAVGMSLSPNATNYWTATTNPVLSWSGASDPESGISRVEYAVDQTSSFTSTGSDASSGSITLPGLANGSHTIYVRAVNLAGNAGPANALGYFVDINPPSAPTGLSTTPAATTSYVMNTSPTINWTGGMSDAQSGLSYVQYKVDSGSWTTLPGSHAISGITSGTHTIYVRGVDAVGNAGSAGSVTYKVDLNPPSTPSVSTTPNGSSAWTGNASPSLSWSGLTDADSGLQKAQYKVDLSGGAQGSWMDIASSTGSSGSITLPALSSSGIYTLSVRGIDNVGNTGSAGTVTYKLDLTQPVPTITSPLNTTFESGSFDIKGTVTANTTYSGISSWKLEYVQGTATTGWTQIATGTGAVNAETTLGTLNTNSLIAGSLYTIRLSTTNGAGTTATSSIQITVDDTTTRLGIKSYWTYTNFSAGNGSGSVNVSSGDLVYQSTDFSFPSLIPMVMTRTYNSQSNFSSSLGKGWDYSFNIKLYPQSNGGMIIKEGDGTLDRFSYSSGSYVPEAGLYMTLEKLGDNTWRATRKDNVKYLFNADFSINKIIDLNGNYLQYAYNTDGSIHTITSSANEVTTFDYYTAADGSGLWTGMLKTVTDPAGRVFTYTYNNSKQFINRSFTLDSVPTYWTEQFAYNTSGQVSGILDGKGHQTTLEYTNNRVWKITSPVTSNYTTITYNTGSTIVANQFSQGTTYAYDSNGLVTTETDALGHATSYAYGTNSYDNRLVTGKSYHNTIDGTDTLITEGYVYDTNGNLSTYTDQLVHQTVYTYDSTLNLVLTQTVKKTTNSADDATTTYVYSTDGKGNLLTETDPKNHTTTYTYYSNGQVHTQTDYNNHTTTYTYNDHGWLTQTQDPSGNITKTLSFDSMGNPLYQESQNGNISKTEYDALGRAVKAYKEMPSVSESNPSSADWANDSKTSTTYDLDGKTTKIISTDDIETDYVFDTLDRQTSITVKSNVTGVDDKTTTTVYSFDVNNYYTVTVTDSDANVQITKYDGLGRSCKAIADPSNKDTEITNTYDQLGNVISQTITDKDLSVSPAQTVTVREIANVYDVANRLTHSTTYDAGIHDAAHTHATNHSYDVILQLNSVDYFVETVSDDNGTKVTYTDKAGSLYREVNSLTGGTSFTFSYTSTGSVDNIKVGGANPRVLIQNTYDPNNNNNLWQTTYGNGQFKHFTPDNQGRVIHERYDTDTTDRYDYGYDDVAGKLNDIVDHIRNIETKYVYDDSGKLTDVNEGPIGFTTASHHYALAYDDNNCVTSVSETLSGQTNVINYHYDSDNQLDTASFNYGTSNNSKTKWTRDDHKRVTERDVFDNNTTQIFATTVNYTEANSTSQYVQTIRNRRVGQSGYDVTLTYTYDGDVNHNIASVSDGTNTTTYVYDAKQQLIRENNQAVSKTWTWTYDSDGNILEKREYAYTTAQDLTGLTNTSVSYTYGDIRGWNDLLTVYNGTAITYDESGNPTYDGTWAYTWAAGHNLVGLSKTGTSVSYTYNQDGIRTSKTVNGVTTNYTMVNNQVTQEADGTNTILYRYDANNNLISMNLNATEYYYIKDAQGDIIGIFDRTGAVVVEYSYDAWGNILSITGSLANTVGQENPYRYRGYRYDSETGLYYLQSRYYNSVWGRFVTSDDVSSGADNLFKYCNNNPVMIIDPTGHFFLVIFGILITAEQLVTMIFASIAIIVTTNYVVQNRYAIWSGLSYAAKSFSDAMSRIQLGINNYFSHQQALINAYNRSLALSIAKSVSSIKWDGDKNHILNGSSNHGGHNWRNIGLDPKDPGTWAKLVALFKTIVDISNFDHEETLKNGDKLFYYVKYLSQYGISVVVKIYQSANGAIKKLSDAWPK